MKYISVFTLFALLTIWAGVIFAGGYNHNVTNNYYIDKTYIENHNNYTGISDKDLATVGSMAGAASSHHFTRGTKSWQGSVGGACYDSSADDCALSFAVAKRPESGDYLYSLSITGASDDRLYAGSIGFTW